MITSFIDSLTKTQKNVLSYSVLLGFLQVIITYVRITKFDYIIGIHPMPVQYSLSRIVYLSSGILITITGSLLHFIFERRIKATLVLAFLISAILVLQRLVADYNWNHTGSEAYNFFLPKWVILIPNPIFLIVIFYSLWYKKSVVLSLISVLLVNIVFLPLIYNFTCFFTTYNQASLFRSFFIWSLFWFSLYFITYKFETSKDFIKRIKGLYSDTQSLSVKEYRIYFLIVYSLMVLLLISSIDPFKLFYATHEWFLLIDLTVFTTLFILLYILSIRILIRRLTYMNLSLDYFWLKFIPILNIYLLYITLVKKEIIKA